MFALHMQDTPLHWPAQQGHSLFMPGRSVVCLYTTSCCNWSTWVLPIHAASKLDAASEAEPARSHMTTLAALLRSGWWRKFDPLHYPMRLCAITVKMTTSVCSTITLPLRSAQPRGVQTARAMAVVTGLPACCCGHAKVTSLCLQPL